MSEIRIFIIIFVLGVTPCSFASTTSVYCSDVFMASHNLKASPSSNKHYRIEYSPENASLEIVFDNGTRQDLMIVWSQEGFPGNYEILANNDFVIGTTTSVYRYKVSNNRAKMIFGYQIFSKPTFSKWVFSKNGRYAVGIYDKSSAENYLQVYVFDSQNTKPAKGSSYAILNTPTDPVGAISISDTGQVEALSTKGNVLLLEE